MLHFCYFKTKNGVWKVDTQKTTQHNTMLVIQFNEIQCNAKQFNAIQ